MRDQFERNIDYLRISITDRCNLRCRYCMPEEGVESVEHSRILTFDEILRVTRLMAELGITKIKVTGGEPLVRKGCPGLVKQLKEIPGIEKVTITTNGVLLSELMPGLKDAGLDAVNISLDTMNAEEFAKITRRDQLEKVLEGVKAAVECQDLPVKINCVPILSDPENLVRMAGLAKEHKVHVRFIEMMPIGLGKQFEFRGEDEIVAILEKAYGPLTPNGETLGNGPCHYYDVQGFQGRIGFISAMTHKFCDQCNRVRLTSEGFLKACLQYQTGADLRELLRNGSSDEEIKAVIHEVTFKKPMSHSFLEKAVSEGEERAMSQIGG